MDTRITVRRHEVHDRWLPELSCAVFTFTPISRIFHDVMMIEQWSCVNLQSSLNNRESNAECDATLPPPSPDARDAVGADHGGSG